MMMNSNRASQSNVDLPMPTGTPLRTGGAGHKTAIFGLVAVILIAMTTWIGLLGWGLFLLARTLFNLL